MKYLFLIYDVESGWMSLSDEEREREIAGYTAFGAEIERRGFEYAGSQLQPTAAATTVRARNGGAAVTTDGPFAETKEQLGGYYLIDCPSLDEALELAALIPATRRGSVEVRPLVER